MTFSMRYHDDYQAAGIPTFPSRYSFEFTRWMIAVSSVLAAFVMGFSIISIGISLGYLGVLISLSLVLVLLAIISLIKPSEKINLGLFKFASLYMIGAMLLIILI
jgi:heme O synthase-like polyprenyltransferase